MSDGYEDYYRGKKVLVTGGLGFIGINTSLRLLDLGAEVTVLDNFIPPDPSGRLDAVRSRLRIAIADIRDEDKVERVVRDQHPQATASRSGTHDQISLHLQLLALLWPGTGVVLACWLMIIVVSFPGWCFLLT